MKLSNVRRKLWQLGLGLAVAGILIFAAMSSQRLAAQDSVGGLTPLPSKQTGQTMSRAEVCAIVLSMPGAEDTDELLALLHTDRATTISNLAAMKRNMEQYDAEGYGWQGVIDGSSALEPRPGSWLIGALRMACEE